MAPKSAMKTMKRPASRARSPAAAAAKSKSKSAARSRSPVPKKAAYPEFRGMRGYIVNLERRADRWKRVQTMLRKETPWLDFEKFPASDGSEREIPEDEVSKSWNTKVKAVYAGCGEGCEWAYVAPGTNLDGTQWKWTADVKEEDEEYRFEKDEDDGNMGTVEEIATKMKFRVKLQKSQQYLEGQTQSLSGGERGCAHSHFRLWKVAADRADNTLVLEDDVQFVFERSDPKLGMANGKVFTDRLRLALKHAPVDFDVIYLGWSGHRGGNFKVWKQSKENGLSKEARKAIRKAEYVWTTVAYVISQAGAKKLLAASKPLNMPVDEFMAAEACQGRLKSFVAMDKGDDDEIWAGGLVDQFDFQGDSDIKKSDGGVQGDSLGEFVVAKSGA